MYINLEIKQEDIDKAVSASKLVFDSGLGICKYCVIWQSVKRQLGIETLVSLYDILDRNDKVLYMLDEAGMSITFTETENWEKIKPQTIKLIKADE